MRWSVVTASGLVAALACGGADEAPPDARVECPARPAECVDECNWCEDYGTQATCRCVAGEWVLNWCPVAHNSCNPVSQTGCCDGDKCALITDQLDPFIGHVGCTPAGPDALGDSCTEAATVGTSDSCAAGGQCHNGRCVAICSSFVDDCVDSVCVGLVDVNGNPLPNELCLPTCDPLAQDCDLAVEACYVVGDGGVCMTAGTLAVDGECGPEDTCLPGLQCVGNPPRCRPLCGPVRDCWGFDTDGNPTSPTACGCGPTTACAANELCWPFIDLASNVAWDTAGYCLPEEDFPSCGCTGDPICT